MRSDHPLLRPTGRRVLATGYGSDLLTRVSAVAPRLEEIQGSGIGPLLRRLRAGQWLMIAYRLALPSLQVPLSSAPSGDVLRQQLSLRSGGRLAHRAAQGVLFLPESYAAYLTGRRRQAVRTNIRRAREAGLTVEVERIDAWGLYPADPRSVHVTARAPMEHWLTFDAEGALVARAELTVDTRTALLHIATSEVSNARWLLHAAIVERLCGECELLITNTDDVPLISAGNQHYQKLLGYSIVRLRLAPTLIEVLSWPWRRVSAMWAPAARRLARLIPVWQTEKSLH